MFFFPLGTNIKKNSCYHTDLSVVNSLFYFLNIFSNDTSSTQRKSYLKFLRIIYPRLYFSYLIFFLFFLTSIVTFLLVLSLVLLLFLCCLPLSLHFFFFFLIVCMVYSVTAFLTHFFLSALQFLLHSHCAKLHKAMCIVVCSVWLSHRGHVCHMKFEKKNQLGTLSFQTKIKSIQQPY